MFEAKSERRDVVFLEKNFRMEVRWFSVEFRRYKFYDCFMVGRLFGKKVSNKNSKTERSYFLEIYCTSQHSRYCVSEHNRDEIENGQIPKSNE